MGRKERGRTARETARGAAPDARALVAQATRLHRMGRLSEASALYRQALVLEPGDADATHLLGLVSHQMGDNEAAIPLLEKAVALDGGTASYRSNLGEAYRALGRLEDAVRCHREALAMRPDMANARFGLGTALLDMRRYAEAAEELGTAVRLDANDADARLNLGIALFELGRGKEAIGHYEAALRLKPDSAELHLNLGIALRFAGELREAYRALGRAIALAPRIAEAHYQIGCVLAGLERYDDAALALAEAVRLAPEMANAHLELGRALRLLHRKAEAIAAYERVLTLAPARPEALIGVGLAHLEAGDFAAARQRFEAALALAPGSADAHFNMGLSYQLQGRFEEAVGWHEKALALEPGHASAHYHLVTDRKAGSGVERLRAIERVLALPALSQEQRSSLEFARAKVLENLADYDAAFLAYKTANDLKKSKQAYRPEEFTAYVDRLIAVFDAAFFAERAGFGSASELPIFIVGMPRSGTTLVEQILASHPQVFGAGELDDMRQIVHGLPNLLGGKAVYPECVRGLDAAAIRTLAEEAIVRLASRAPEAARITDKLPNNFARLGLIALLFPQARIVHCVRDALDTCLSCYCQEFAHGQPFTSDLGHLGRYYRDYERLMAHWNAVLPSAMLEVPYEALVAEQEAWSRRLVAAAGLPWDERCLAFYESERLVRTASLWQVRQPIYASSVGRWRSYAKHLGPLMEALGMERPPA